jgi:hypothetical protein
MAWSKRKQKVVQVNENLDRFAGSSDEEEEKEPTKKNMDRDAGDDASAGSSKEAEDSGNNDEGDKIASDDEILQPEVGPEANSAKMANAMAKILGTTTQKMASTSVVLSKTTTPLQRAQMKEKEKVKKLKEKRRENREISLTALHIPLSVATTNTIQTGKNSVAKELEQERFHRRVATRGVVALFNAITQHQKLTEVCFLWICC